MLEHRLQAADVWGHIAPMFHLVDAYAIFSITWVGGRHVMQNAFSADAVTALIERHGITVFNVASTMVTLIVAHPSSQVRCFFPPMAGSLTAPSSRCERALHPIGSPVAHSLSRSHFRPPSSPASQTRDLSSLQLVSCGGAPLSQRTVERACAIFGTQCEFFLSYGMTECCGKISMSLLTDEVRELAPARQLDYVCSSGRAFALVEVRVATAPAPPPPPPPAAAECSSSEAWQRVKRDARDVGEVLIRGPTVFSEYWRNEKATAESFVVVPAWGPRKWFRTGDLATIDARGYLSICDRAKDMILTGSENVYSVEVERVLHDHPAVKHASVYGVPNALLGEIVKAVVVLHHANQATMQQLQAHCGEFLADYKVPRVVTFMTAEELPLTGSGKVAKAELKRLDSGAAPPSQSPANRGGGGGGGAAAAGTASSSDSVLRDAALRVEWAAAPLRASTRFAVHGSWAVLGSGDVAAGLRRRLGDAGAELIAAATSTCFDEPSVAAFLRAASALGNLVCVVPSAESGGDGVGGGPGAPSLSARDRAHAALRPFVTLFAAISDWPTAQIPRVWVVTRGAAVHAPIFTSGALDVLALRAVDPTHQAVWGLVRSAVAEQPRLRCRLVDLCPCEGDSDQDVEALATELAAGLADDAGWAGESAWRARCRFAPSLAPADLPAVADARPTIDAAASYVVTGGLGGLGRQLARFLLLRWGAKCVVLVGRRSPSDDVARELRALEAEAGDGARCITVQADVAIRADVERLLAPLAPGARGGAAEESESTPPCAGIFHLAGIVDDGTMAQQTWERFESVLRAKVDGSIHLSEVSRAAGLKLTHFVRSSLYLPLHFTRIVLTI